MQKFGRAARAALVAVLVMPCVAGAGPSSGGGKGIGNSGGTNPGDQGGFAKATYTETVTTVETSSEQFMGMSQKAPPNAKAAASKGVRTETTTTTTVTEITYEVNGPPGQIKDQNYGCDNCTTTETTREVISVTSETSSTGPGNSNH